MRKLNLLEKAENFAKFVISVKDKVLGQPFENLIPQPKTRQKIRQYLIDLLRPISKPFSESVDRLIEQDKITVSNILSISRALAGPYILFLILQQANTTQILLVVLWAALSDYYDGWWARKLDQVTKDGAALDPLCDKIFATCFGLAYLQYLWWWNFGLFLIIDLILAGLAWRLHVLKKRNLYHGHAQVKANWLGKIKFNIQGAAAIYIVNGYYLTGNYMLLIASAFALGSLVRHLYPKPQT